LEKSEESKESRKEKMPEVDIEWVDKDELLLAGENYKKFKDIFAKFTIHDKINVSIPQYKLLFLFLTLK